MKESQQIDVATILADQRRRIDEIDDQIMQLLGERLKIVHEVCPIKYEKDIAVVQGGRVEEVKDRNAATAEKYGVSPDLIRNIYDLIIDESHVIEQAFMDARNK